MSLDESAGQTATICNGQGDSPPRAWRARCTRLALGAWLLALASPPARAEMPQPERDRLHEHVARLASGEFEGRRGAGGLKAGEYVASAFRELGLEPLFEKSFFQEIPPREAGQRPAGRNVGAMLRGSDPALRDEWVIIAAHFDHLGVKNGVLYPGADDNASGVAMLLETARCLTQSAEKPRRSIMFVSFDLEEYALWGSRYFAEHMPVPMERVGLFVVADMIGRSLGNVCDPYVFVIGSEHAPGLRPWVAQASADRPITVGLLGTDMVGVRSDYGPFILYKVPYLFVSTGENPNYHKPNDVAETINYPKCEAISRMIIAVLRQAVAADSLPKWSSRPEYPFSEVVVLRDVMNTLVVNREKLNVGVPQLLMMRNTVRKLDEIIARGSITTAERRGVVPVIQLILLAVL